MNRANTTRSGKVYSAAKAASTKRCCSFCRGAGHNISHCTDSRINQFQEQCNRELSSGRFLYWDNYHSHLNTVFRRKCKLMRAFAATKCNVSASLHREGIVSQVFKYLKDAYHIQRYGSATSRANDDDDDDDESATTTSTTNAQSIRIVYVRPSSKIQLQECAICYDTNIEPKNVVQLNCGHDFCASCIASTLTANTTRAFSCAMCRTPVQSVVAHNIHPMFKYCFWSL